MELERLGLTNTEAKVYKSLLYEGSCLASQLIKKLQLHRATVYDVLDRLVEKGLASYIIKNKKKYYTASNPEKFLDIIKERKEQLENEEKEAEKIVKELEKIKEKTPSSSIEVLSGKEGLKNLMQDLLTVKEFLIIGGELRFEDYLPIYTIHWAKERENKNVFARILSNLKPTSTWKYNKHKQLPKDRNFPTSTIIYNNNVALILPEEPLRILIIKSEKTAEAYRSEFEMLWKISK
jgi:sugar-specific transcriptional regulator TrmB